MKIRPVGLREALMYTAEMPRRFAALGAHLTHQSAQAMQQAVAAGQPEGRDGDQLRQALVVAKVVGSDLTAKGRLPKAFAVMLDAGRAPVAKLRDLGKQDILYVRPKKRRMVRTAPEVAVLARFSPWPLDLLPMFPSRRQALLVYRRVAKEEANRVRDARIADAPQWRAQLATAGVDTAKPRPAPPKVTVTPDVMFFAARQEFGGGRTRPLKLWRKALRPLVRSSVRTIMRQPAVVKLLSDPDDSGWKTLAKIPVEHRITEQQAEDFKQFQKRVVG